MWRFYCYIQSTFQYYYILHSQQSFFSILMFCRKGISKAMQVVLEVTWNLLYGNIWNAYEYEHKNLHFHSTFKSYFGIALKERKP